MTTEAGRISWHRLGGTSRAPLGLDLRAIDQGGQIIKLGR